jgi:hypothetical protein
MMCVPTPLGEADKFVKDDAINVSVFWELMSRPVVRSEAANVWLLGEGANLRNDALVSLEAPDFTLPDFDGNLHSLSDFRGKRVLLITGPPRYRHPSPPTRSWNLRSLWSQTSSANLAGHSGILTKTPR